jgi:ribose 5-phosphate isomerase B
MATRPSDAELRELIRRSLQQVLEGTEPPSAPAPSPPVSKRLIVDGQDVARAAPGSTLDIPPDALITPLAREIALERQVSLSTGRALPQSGAPPRQTIAIGADHGGYALKEQLKPFLSKLGWQVVDCGAHNTESVDYPDFAFAVARMVSQQRARWGIVIDGAGIGSCIVANKVPGVRAALCYDVSSAANSREHNHANVLTLGAGLIGANLAQQIVKTWLDTPFGPDRHARRVEKITQIEQRYTKK